MLRFIQLSKMVFYLYINNTVTSFSENLRSVSQHFHDRYQVPAVFCCIVGDHSEPGEHFGHTIHLHCCQGL